MASLVEVRKAQPFDSFRNVFVSLVYLGCYKLLQKPSKRWILYLHYLHRLFYVLCLTFLNVQHLSFIALYCDDMDSLLNVLAMEIPQLNLLMKFLTLYLRTSRIDKLHEIINGPFFTANSDKDEEFLTKNSLEMNRLMKIINIGIIICVSTWVVAFFLIKIQGGDVVLPLVLPVGTDTWLGFLVSITLFVGVSVLLGGGHMAMDCLVATYYAQATTQLKILNHNLEHMFDGGNIEPVNARFTYKDVKDKKIWKRFVYYVQKYDVIVWFTKEVNSVFDFAVSFQFLTATASTCFVIYALSQQQASAQFLFLVVLLFVFQTQVFLYCYYGSLVEFESQSVSRSAFQSDWLAISPRFRGCLLIAMTRWTEPLKTRVSVVIPLSLSTFITIVKSGYSLFTLMSQSTN